MTRLLRFFGRQIREFRHATRGANLVLVALCMIPLIGFIGLATDGARGYLAKAKLSQAIDAGGLAAGRETTQAAQQATLERYFAANFPVGFMDATVTGPILVPDETGMRFTVTASAVVPTTFMRVLNLDTMEVSARTVIQRNVTGMEVALVMDNTGSMLGAKMEAMKAGALNLVNILFGSQESIIGPNGEPLLYVGLVPYGATVNIGNSRTDWLVPACTLPHAVLYWQTQNQYRRAGAYGGAQRPTASQVGDRVVDPATGIPWYVSHTTDDPPIATTVGTTFEAHRAANPGFWSMVTYRNEFQYGVGYRVYDTSNNTIWEAAVAHTSPPAPTTFAEDRAAHAQRWAQILNNCIADDRLYGNVNGVQYTHPYYYDPARTYLSGGLAASGYNFTETVSTTQGTMDGTVGARSLTYSEMIPAGWKGCVMERNGPNGTVGNAVNDAPPSVERFRPYYYPDASDNNWVVPGNTLTSNPQLQPQGVTISLSQNNSAQNSGRGPNLGCGGAITPMTPYKASILAGINRMLAWGRGGTATDIGLAWGWRMISPRWRGLWGGDTPADMPLDYNTENMVKVIVILTDGENQFHDEGDPGPVGSDYTAYDRIGYGLIENATTTSAGKTAMNNRMSATCTALKNQGVVIYTILFQVSGTAVVNLFRNCATDPAHYFNAPDTATLRTAFQQIGNELASLRIAE